MPVYFSSIPCKNGESFETGLGMHEVDVGDLPHQNRLQPQPAPKPRRALQNITANWGSKLQFRASPGHTCRPFLHQPFRVWLGLKLAPSAANHHL